MLCNIYLRKDIVYIPTTGRTDAGFYINIDPVNVIHVTDTEVLHSSIKNMLDKGNPQIPTPTRNTFPKPVLLNYVKVKSWAQFEDGAICFEVFEKDGLYKIQQMKKSESKGWEDNPTNAETFTSQTEVDTIVQKIVELIQSKSENIKINNNI
ncbi:MAG: hypothetical protein WC666_02630 [Candidatus Paceibacterota bacterium]|jgi:hypothetical protein